MLVHDVLNEEAKVLMSYCAIGSVLFLQFHMSREVTMDGIS